MKVFLISGSSVLPLLTATTTKTQIKGSNDNEGQRHHRYRTGSSGFKDYVTRGHIRWLPEMFSTIL
jgi:hypothetical protein